MINGLKENWYVLQVIGGKEKRVLEHLDSLKLENYRPYLPLKKLKIKKGGKSSEKLSPLYPGYLFMIGSWDIYEIKTVLGVSDVIKLVGGISSPGILEDGEKRVINAIAGREGVAPFSKVVNEGTKIRVISGPLKELEGKIISVDRRKQRAIVEMPLLNSSIKVTLGFEFFEEGGH